MSPCGDWSAQYIASGRVSVSPGDGGDKSDGGAELAERACEAKGWRRRSGRSDVGQGHGEEDVEREAPRLRAAASSLRSTAAIESRIAPTVSKAMTAEAIAHLPI